MKHGQDSYSQLACDVIAQYLLKKQSNVTYIDIGCLYPVEASNTYLFYKNGGCGLCIDPNPTVAGDFEALRPRDSFVNCGVGGGKAEMTYHMYENPVYNTFSMKQALKVSRKAARGYTKCNLIEKRLVSVLPLQDIVKNSGFEDRLVHLDFMTIDAEGFEMDILTAVDFDYIRPRLICLEMIVDPSVPINLYDSEVARCLAGSGYHLSAFTGHDAFFIRGRP